MQSRSGQTFYQTLYAARGRQTLEVQVKYLL